MMKHGGGVDSTGLDYTETDTEEGEARNAQQAVHAVSAKAAAASITVCKNVAVPYLPLFPNVLGRREGMCISL